MEKQNKKYFGDDFNEDMKTILIKASTGKKLLGRGMKWEYIAKLTLSLENLGYLDTKTGKITDTGKEFLNGTQKEKN
ncbi:MAG: hypothetical protein ABIP51_18080 [Bacteroidia bacterium]